MALLFLAAPLATAAQQTGKVWRIGFLSVSYASIEDILFRQFREFGYVEGQNLVVDRRYSEGRAERFAELAAELVRLNPDIIVVTTTPAVLAVKRATKTVPIVQPNSLDPVGRGLVASLARPGGSFTGTTQQAADTTAKRLQLLVEAIPRISTVAVVWNAANPGNKGSWREVRSPLDFDRIFAAMTRERPDALLLIGDRLTLPHGQQTVDFVTQKRIPSMFDRPYLVTAGGLMSYGRTRRNSGGARRSWPTRS